MARKRKIKLNQSQDMEAIDTELAAAIEALDQKNDEVEGVLAEYAPPPPETETTDLPDETAGQSQTQDAPPQNTPGDEPQEN